VYGILQSGPGEQDARASPGLLSSGPSDHRPAFLIAVPGRCVSAHPQLSLAAGSEKWPIGEGGGGGTYGKPGEVKVWEGRPSKELPDEEELAYRLFHTQSNFGRYRECFQAARVAKDDFAAR
jgi:hypothetical protein